jgi:hypothetical protein
LRRLFPLFALMLVMGAFRIMGAMAAYAAEPEQSPEPAAEQGEALLTVKEVWLTGDILNISVTDNLGAEQILELNLRDYARPGDEYVTVQATDSAGHTSNSIQFKNPYYTASAEPPAGDGGTAETPSDTPPESAIPDGPKPFTPGGSGTVIDNATDDDGKEFFTVDTPDGNTFYLIVDRRRSTDNVYLLDAVSEDDLASLAKPGDGKTPAVTPATPVPPAVATPGPAPAAPTPESVPVPEKDNNGGIIAFVVITILAVGGAGYYFKIVRPKKNGGEDDDYVTEDFDNDTEADLGSGEDGEDR